MQFGSVRFRSFFQSSELDLRTLLVVVVDALVVVVDALVVVVDVLIVVVAALVAPVAVTIMHELYQISQQASCMGQVNIPCWDISLQHHL